MIKALLVLSAIFAIAFTQNATYTYKYIDGINITLDVYIPNQSPFSKYPVFFTIHGGGYVESSKHDGLSPLEVTEVLSLGFVYVTIDYRLNPGVLLGDIVQDVQDAYTWVYNELPKYVNVNVDAMIVCGRSAGGGLALIGGYTFNPRPKALLVFYPGNSNYTDPAVYNPDTPLPEYIVIAANLLRKPILAEYIPATSVDPYWALFWNAYQAGKNGWLFVSTDPKEPSDQILASLKNFSAVYFVDEQYPPTYFVHGLKDGLVNTNQSIMMANALHAQNIPYVLDLVPGFDHAFDEAITDPNNGTYQEYIIPAFQWAEQMIQSEFGYGNENEKIYYDLIQ